MNVLVIHPINYSTKIGGLSKEYQPAQFNYFRVGHVDELLSLTVLDFTSHSRLMFTSHSRPILTSHSRPMFTTHSRPVFTTVAKSLPRKAEWESKRHGANTHELHQGYLVSVTERSK